MRALSLSFLVLLLGSACATGLRHNHAPVPAPRKNARTVVLFMVDGLSVKALQAAFRKGLMPHTHRFFLRGDAKFAIGQAEFPSLTYPNIASVLTTKPVGEHPVISNHILYPSGKVMNFEAAKFHPLLRATVDPISLIQELKNEGRETASFSYVFGLNADSHMQVGITEGLEYSRHDYHDLDERLIANFEEFLAGRKNPHTWPDFIYMHLVGVDGVSHMFGPRSREALSYLSWLDSRLSRVLRTLASAENAKHSVVSILTSDHGFVETNRRVRLGKMINKSDLGIVVTNEARFLGLHLPAKRSPVELAPLLAEMRAVKGVELTALRNGSRLEIANGQVSFRFEIGPAVCESAAFSLSLEPDGNSIIPASASYHCPSDFDELRSRYPFLVSGLARFLTAPNHPDAVVVAKPDATFAAESKGSHGGPTAEEVYVPILLRNASLTGSGPTRTSDLLKILRKPQAAN